MHKIICLTCVAFLLGGAACNQADITPSPTALTPTEQLVLQPTITPTRTPTRTPAPTRTIPPIETSVPTETPVRFEGPCSVSLENTVFQENIEGGELKIETHKVFSELMPGGINFGLVRSESAAYFIVDEEALSEWSDGFIRDLVRYNTRSNFSKGVSKVPLRKSPFPLHVGADDEKIKELLEENPVVSNVVLPTPGNSSKVIIGPTFRT